MKRIPLSVVEERLAKKPKKVDWTLAEDLKIILLQENLKVVHKWRLMDKWHLIAKILGYTPWQCFDRYLTVRSARQDAKCRLDLKKKQDEVVPKKQALDVPAEANTRMKLISEVSKLQSEVSKLQSIVDAIKGELRMTCV